MPQTLAALGWSTATPQRTIPATCTRVKNQTPWWVQENIQTSVWYNTSCFNIFNHTCCFNLVKFKSVGYSPSLCVCARTNVCDCCFGGADGCILLTMLADECQCCRLLMFVCFFETLSLSNLVNTESESDLLWVCLCGMKCSQFYSFILFNTNYKHNQNAQAVLLTEHIAWHSCDADHWRWRWGAPPSWRSYPAPSADKFLGPPATATDHG